MFNIKSFKKNKKTANVVFEFDNEMEFKQIIAFILMLNSYNPLRKFSDNGIPMDYELYKEYKIKLEGLISDIAYDMNIDTNLIDKLG